MSESTPEHASPAAPAAPAPDRTPRFGPGLVRVLPAIAAAAAFVAAAALVQPDWSRADSIVPADPADPAEPAEPGPAAATGETGDAEPFAGSHAADAPSLGMLESRGHRIDIRGTVDGPRYHLLDADGRSLHPSGWTLEALAERFPELDLRAATAETAGISAPDSGAAPTLLMLAPVDHPWPW